MWRCGRINIVCGLLLPMIALAQDPVSQPAPATPEVDEKINEPGTADTTPPDPTILAPNRLDPLSDDPGQQYYDPTKPKERAGVRIRNPGSCYRAVHRPRARGGVEHSLAFVHAHGSMVRRQRGDESLYQQASGSIAPALLWDKFDGLTPRLRFDADMPLPHLNSRLHAFIGRVNRDEYVTERSPQSGAFAKQYGPLEDDETLFGIRYREPKQGGHFTADAGIRFRTPPDPFVKGSYRFIAAPPSARSTAFVKPRSGRTARSLASPAVWTSSGSSKTRGCCAGPDRAPFPRRPKASEATPQSP